MVHAISMHLPSVSKWILCNVVTRSNVYSCEFLQGSSICFSDPVDFLLAKYIVLIKVRFDRKLFLSTCRNLRGLFDSGSPAELVSRHIVQATTLYIVLNFLIHKKHVLVLQQKLLPVHQEGSDAVQ